MKRKNVGLSVRVNYTRLTISLSRKLLVRHGVRVPLVLITALALLGMRYVVRMRFMIELVLRTVVAGGVRLTFAYHPF